MLNTIFKMKNLGGFAFEVQLSITEKGQYAVAYGLSCKKDCHELHTTDPRRTIPYPIPVPPPQKPLHRRQARSRKNTGRAYRRTVLHARRGCLPKGVKSPQPKADRKGQSQTVQTLRAQHPLKYLLHIAHLPKSSFYYHHQDRPDPDETDKALIAEIYEQHKRRYGQRRIAAALGWNCKKMARLMK